MQQFFQISFFIKEKDFYFSYYDLPQDFPHNHFARHLCQHQVLPLCHREGHALHLFQAVGLPLDPKAGGDDGLPVKPPRRQYSVGARMIGGVDPPVVWRGLQQELVVLVLVVTYQGSLSTLGWLGIEGTCFWTVGQLAAARLVFLWFFQVGGSGARFHGRRLSRLRSHDPSFSLVDLKKTCL